MISGVAGGCAQVMYVLPLMWLRTIMEYQYKNGEGIVKVATTLYQEGGIARFYRGLMPALILAPTARFGDTAANELALSSLSSVQMPLALKTLCASVTAAMFRVVILPLDAWKVNKQVHGKAGLEHLLRKARVNPLSLWHGGMGVLVTGGFGHYPWFYTNNLLREILPPFEMRYGKHVRHAFIGFTSSVVADAICNPIRVLKVNRQTSLTRISYLEAAQSIIQKEGLIGLWSRGLKTRILANGVQGSLFTVGWRYFSEVLSGGLTT
ncbi:MDC1 [Symbiodinium pilosum]|uniref:MDC1 protein n=1 Tax=Symbiodinium pilosum TaxID=2952 RepID=A0A812PCD3_SYMPI|nr:MDC1 [Symbiodinium pilosum]